MADPVPAWVCALLILGAGAVGGVVNALMTDNGFVLPTRERSILCPGFVSNVLVGALAAFSSWAFYGSGAGVATSAPMSHNDAEHLTHAPARQVLRRVVKMQRSAGAAAALGSG
jgi:hypothetical protein